MPELHIEGLLHLAAMVVIISAGYIGLDSIRHEPDRLHVVLKSTSEKIDKLFLRLDLKLTGADNRIRDIYNIYDIHFLCFVAKKKIKLGLIGRILHVLKRQTKTPFLGYFRSKTDIIVMTFISIISSVIFLVISYESVWHTIDIKIHDDLVWYSYIFLVLSLLWMFLSISLSSRLMCIQTLCDKAIHLVEERLKEIRADAMSEAVKFEEHDTPQT